MATNVKLLMTPVGRRSDGSIGQLLDPTTDIPLVSVLEVLATLPSDDDPNNFDGRLAFDRTTKKIYVYDGAGMVWIAMRQSPVTIDTVDPVPGTPIASAGDLYYATTSEVLYLWDGTAWISVGGARAAKIVWTHYTGDGTTVQYLTGASTNPPVEYVQVFVNGVALRPGTSSVRDYYMVGNSVRLNSAPANGATISVRTVTFAHFGRNSAFITQRYVSDGTLLGNEYDAGIVQSTASQIFVAVDGVLQTPFFGGAAGTYDYKVFSQDTTITTLTSSGSTCTVTTAIAHGLTVGKQVIISGALQSAYNGTFVVSAVPNSTQFRYTALSVPASSPATPNPVLFFGPTARNDYIKFYNAAGNEENFPSGAVVVVRSVENIVSEGSVGAVLQVTNGSNVGGGSNLFKEKTGSLLAFKTLIAGNYIDLTEGTDTITIDAEHQTHINYATFNGVGGTYNVGETDMWVAVKNASGNNITISLASITGAGQTGRRVYIKDAALNAATNSITVVPNAGSKLERPNGTLGANGAGYAMSVNGEMCAWVFNGSDWEMLVRNPGPTGATGSAGSVGATGPAGPQGDPGTSAFVIRQELDGATDPYILENTVSYVGVKNTSGSSLTINIFTNVTDNGRKIIVKDESGNAGTYNIIINPGPSRAINGGANGATVSITTNYGSLELVFDGLNKYFTI